MKKTLLNLGYLSMDFDTETQILHLNWNEKSADIDPNEYKHSAFSFRDLVLKESHIKLVLNNLQKFQFTITPILQDFIASEIMNPLFTNGLKKMALVMPEELFAMVSTEQVIEEIVEVNKANEKLQNFDAVQKAEEWLLKE